MNYSKGLKDLESALDNLESMGCGAKATVFDLPIENIPSGYKEHSDIDFISFDRNTKTGKVTIFSTDETVYERRKNKSLQHDSDCDCNHCQYVTEYEKNNKVTGIAALFPSS